MTACWTAVFFLQLLTLATSQDSVNGNYTHVLQRNENAAVNIVSSLKEVGHVMKCFGGITQESMRFHKQNSEVLTDLRELPNQMATLTRGIEDIKTQLGKRDDKIESLTQENEKIKLQLTSKDTMVQDLERRLQESQKLVQNLTETVNVMADAIKTLNKTTEGTERCLGGEETTRLVQEYNRNKNWAALRRGLEEVLDQGSSEYRQLQNVQGDDSMMFYHMGMHGLSELVALLLCGGLPASSADADGDGLLHGMAGGGHPLLVKMLLDKGASLEARGWQDRTPVMVAAAGGNLEATQVLVRAGANTMTMDSFGRTALDWANYQNHPEVAQWLSDFPH